MLKSKVGYSMDLDDITTGVEAAKHATKGFSNVKLSFLYTSCKNDIKKVVKGIREITDSPLIGCTSSGGVIVPDGYVTSEKSFAGPFWRGLK